MSGTLNNNVNLFQNMCRICLEQNASLQNIFGLSLNTIITQCTTVQISFNDGLPQMVCDHCIVMAKHAIQFKAQCETSDMILRKMLSDPFTDNIVTNNEDSKDPLYIPKSDFSLANENKRTECFHVNSENNCKLMESPNFNGIEGGEVEPVIVKTEMAEDLNIINELDVNDEFNVLLQKENKKTKRYNCMICKDYFRNKKDLSKHIDEAHDERPFKCHNCPRTFTLKVNLSRHLKIHIGDKPFSCSVCDKRFFNKWELGNHSWQHKSKEERPVLCSYCGKKSIDKRSLAYHIKAQHERGNYQCEHCSKNYPSPKSLKTHIRIHTGEGKVVCTVCGQQLSSPTSLKRHMRTHNNESENDRPFSCTECLKKFYTNADLGKHIKIHTGEKIHVCDVCKKAFAHKITLKNHMWMHKGEYPFQCDVCEKKFLLKRSLLKHKKKRHEETPFALNNNN